MKAFDLDGVFCDFTLDCFRPAAERVLGRKLYQHTEKVYDLCEQFGLSEEENTLIWDSQQLRHTLWHAPVMNDIAPLLIQSDEPYCFITSRPENHIKPTRAWVRRVLGSDREVYFSTPENKVIWAKRLGVETMWEDNPTIVADLIAAGITVHMPLYDYNAEIRHPLVKRIPNWRRPLLVVA